MKDMNKSNGLFTDKEYIEELGLDPSLEGKPEINGAIRKAVLNSTVREYVKNGMTEAKAINRARKAMK